MTAGQGKGKLIESQECQCELMLTQGIFSAGYLN